MPDELTRERTHWDGCWQEHRDCAVAEVQRLRAQLAELRRWKDEAVRSCGQRQCATRDRRLEDAQTELATLRVQLAGVQAEFREQMQLTASAARDAERYLAERNAVIAEQEAK